MFGKYIYAALGVALLLSGATAYLQYKRANKAETSLSQSIALRESDLKTFENAKQQLQGSVDRLIAQHEEDQEKIDTMTKNNAKVIYERDAAIAKFNSYRAALAKATTARPRFWADRATRRTNELFGAFSKATNRDKDGGDSSRSVQSTTTR